MKALRVNPLLWFALCLSLGVMLFAAVPQATPARAASVRHARALDFGLSFGLGELYLYPESSYQWQSYLGTTLELIYQSDGNLVEYCVHGSSKTPIWATGTNNILYLPDHVSFQTDGNLVVYGNLFSQGIIQAQWASGTNNKGATLLRLQADDNIVIYNSSGKAIWATNRYNQC